MWPEALEVLDREARRRSMTAKAASQWRARIAKQSLELADAQESEVNSEDSILRWERTAARAVSRHAPLGKAARLMMSAGSFGEAAILLARAIRLAPSVRCEDLTLLSECLHHSGENALATEIDRIVPGLRARDVAAMQLVQELRAA
jgi:hypothetical protein